MKDTRVTGWPVTSFWESRVEWQRNNSEIIPQPQVRNLLWCFRMILEPCCPGCLAWSASLACCDTTRVVWNTKMRSERRSVTSPKDGWKEVPLSSASRRRETASSLSTMVVGPDLRFPSACKVGMSAGRDRVRIRVGRRKR